ncbi:MAG: hypothetical protein QOJ69_1039 [Actinomycetota bacterium]|nr:hypothetical protein [Actinomycetota bacterium]
MIRRPLAVVAVGALLLAGCAKSTPGTRALDATQDKLDEVRSGTLSLQLLASSTDAPEGTGAGFLLEGPFAVGAEEGSLPVADLRFTRITGPDRHTTRFISTGSRAFVEVGGDVTELTDEQLADLRVRDGASTEGLEGLTLTRWLDEPSVGPGPEVDGAPTEQVTGKADAVAILNDVIGLLDQFGTGQDGVERLEGDAADRVRRAVASAGAEVVTGRDDRLLRRANASVDLAVADPEVRKALGDLAGARLALSLEVTNLNQPVEVGAP